MTKKKAKVKKIFHQAKKEGRSVLTLTESFEVLKTYNIPIASYAVAQTADRAMKAAKKIKYPVVLKAISKKATHKTDVGGLILNIQNEKSLRKSFERIKKNLKRAKADFEGVVVQKMFGPDYDKQEVLVGGKKDPQFGQTIAFGLGGVFVEVFEDVSFRVVPVTKKDIEEMIKEIKGYKILYGYRGKKYDIKALSNILMKVSNLLEQNEEIAELDINPVMALQRGAVAVDARIVIG